MILADENSHGFIINSPYAEKMPIKQQFDT